MEPQYYSSIQTGDSLLTQSQNAFPPQFQPQNQLPQNMFPSQPQSSSQIYQKVDEWEQQQQQHQQQVVYEINQGDFNGNEDTIDRYSGAPNNPEESMLNNNTSKLGESDVAQYCCTICSVVSTVDALYCNDCKEIFCRMCDKIVHDRRFKNHERVPLNEKSRCEMVPVNPVLQDKDLGKCPKHNKEFVVRCKEDGAFCCPECLMSTEHIGHTVFNITTNFNEIRNSFIDNTTTVDASKELLETNRGHLREQQKLSDDSYYMAKTTINELFDDLAEKVNRRKEAMMTEIENTRVEPDNDEDEIKRAIDAVGEELAELEKRFPDEEMLSDKEIVNMIKEDTTAINDEVKMIAMDKTQDTDFLTLFREKLAGVGGAFEKDISRLDADVRKLEDGFGTTKKRQELACKNTTLAFMKVEKKDVDNLIAKLSAVDGDTNELHRYIGEFVGSKKELGKKYNDLKKELEEKARQTTELNTVLIQQSLKEYNEVVGNMKKIRQRMRVVPERPSFHVFGRALGDIERDLNKLCSITQSMDHNASKVSWSKPINGVVQDTKSFNVGVRNTDSESVMHIATPMKGSVVNYPSLSVSSKLSEGSGKSIHDWFFGPLEVHPDREEDKTVKTYRSILERSAVLKPEMFSLPQEAKEVAPEFKDVFDMFNNVRMEYINKYASGKARSIISDHLLRYMGITRGVSGARLSVNNAFSVFFTKARDILSTLTENVKKAPGREVGNAHDDVQRVLNVYVRYMLKEMDVKGITDSLADIDGCTALMLANADVRSQFVDDAKSKVKYSYRSPDGKKAVFLVPNGEHELCKRVESMNSSEKLVCSVEELNYFVYTFKEPDPSKAKTNVMTFLSGINNSPCWYVVLNNSNDYRIVISTVSIRTESNDVECISSDKFKSYFQSNYCYCDINSL